MWEVIEHLLNGSNAIAILLFMVFVVIVLAILSKKGLISINTSTIQIGAADRERDIIRQQVEWIHMHVQGFENSLDKVEGYNEWLGRYIAEKVYDEYVSMITFNHISASPAYVDIKADKLISIVHKYASKDEYKSEEFDETIRRDTRDCIEKLIQIRKVYK